jgi:hypothetical protein
MKRSECICMYETTPGGESALCVDRWVVCVLFQLGCTIVTDGWHYLSTILRTRHCTGPRRRSLQDGRLCGTYAKPEWNLLCRRKAGSLISDLEESTQKSATTVPNVHEFDRKPDDPTAHTLTLYTTCLLATPKISFQRTQIPTIPWIYTKGTAHSHFVVYSLLFFCFKEMSCISIFLSTRKSVSVTACFGWYDVLCRIFVQQIPNAPCTAI